MEDYLMHHGIKGQKWGKKNGPPYPLKSDYKDPKAMSDAMKKWKYSEYNTLQTPASTKMKRSGSCHDQAFYEMDQLRKMGYEPQMTFVMEHDGKGQVGMTHTYVHYQDGNKHYWFENAWGGREGVHEFVDPESIRKEIKMAHKTGEFGDSKRYSEIEFVDADPSYHTFGEDLQDYVDNCLRSDDEVKHMDWTDADGNYLAHFGVKGMKWGIRKEPGSSGQRSFISGSSKTQDRNSPYFRRKLPKSLRQYIDKGIQNGDSFIVGDAPGIDRQTQDYLKRKNYPAVKVYSPGTQARYIANKKWSQALVDSKYPKGSKEWLAEKDKVMARDATKGYAVILDNGSSATRKNIARMQKMNKPMKIHELHENTGIVRRALGSESPYDRDVRFRRRG